MIEKWKQTLMLMLSSKIIFVTEPPIPGITYLFNVGKLKNLLVVLLKSATEEVTMAMFHGY